MAKKQNEVKICLWTHVQNEAPVIRKMLESAVDYIDYWVLVDNGSTDGTQDIIKDFFEEHDVEGKLYQSEIGWKGHGINRQHSWDFLENTDHGCDYILRIDADEGIKVADDFDWSIIPTQEAWSVIYEAGGHIVPRMWLWKWGLPWYWADDVAHETIHLKDGREPNSPNLPMSFKHISLGGGNSYSNPIKYIQDILKLENQLHERFRDGSDLEAERYHMFYLCKSFNYTGYSLDNEWCHQFFPYGKDQLKNFLERGLFYYDQLLNHFGEEWYTFYLKGQLLERLNRKDEAKAAYEKSCNLRPDRGEPLHALFFTYYHEQNWEKAFEHGFKIRHLKCPVDTDPWQIDLMCYFENSWQLRDAVAVVVQRMGSKILNKELLEESKAIFTSLMEDANQDNQFPNRYNQLLRIEGNLNYINDELKNINEKEN